MVERYKGNYEVGYRKPPEHTRFRKGKSGNPRGLRRKPDSVAVMLAQELQSTVVMRDKGRRHKVTKLRLFVREALNLAIEGKPQLLAFALKMFDFLERLNVTPTKRDSRYPSQEELAKMSSEELQRCLREAIANSPPLPYEI